MSRSIAASAARHTAEVDDSMCSVAEAADRLKLSVAWTRRLIATGSLASTKIGARRYVPSGALAEYDAARQVREHALRAAASTDWDWEGNLVDTLARWLGRQGWTEVSRAETALREHGIDLVVEKDGRQRVIEVKGWPTARHATGPRSGQVKRWRPTMARNCIGDLVFSAMVLRSSHPDDEVAIAVPERETYTSLLERIRPSLETLGVGAYVIDERGDVKSFVAIEEVDAGRVSRDEAVDRAFVRRLVEMTDAEREVHFVSSNRAALEMLADGRRAG